MKGKGSSSSIRIYLLALAAGAAVGLVDYFLGIWIASRGSHAEATLVDEFLLAIFTAVLLLVIEFAHRREQERMNERLRTIRLMNHHIRNALQSISDSAYIHGHLDEIQRSVERIVWALREILPGSTPDEDADLVRPADSTRNSKPETRR